MEPPSSSSETLSPSGTATSSKRRHPSSDETVATSIDDDYQSTDNRKWAPIPKSIGSPSRTPSAVRDPSAVTIDGSAWREEILNPPHASPMLTFPIEEDHPLIPAWHGIKLAILQTLQGSKINWTALEVFRRRETTKPTIEDTTVLLTITGDTQDVDAADNDPQLRNIRERIFAICLKNGHGYVHVETIYGRAYRNVSLDLPFKKEGQLGASIGIGNSSGTLGGYVALSIGNNPPKVYGLTCHHVVRPNEIGGLLPYSEENKQNLVFQPSSVDMEDTFAEYKAAIAMTSSLIARHEKSISDGMATENTYRYLEDQLAIKSRNEGTLSAAQSFDSKFGTIHATSGFLISKRRNCSVDWALVEVDKHRQGSNKTPGIALAGRPGFESSEVRGISTLMSTTKYSKTGRTTGTTFGSFSHIKSHVQLPDNPGYTDEAVVMSLQPGKFFSEKGDSGAFLLSPEGELVGLVVGGCEPERQTYVTPIEEVISSIREITGCNVSLLAAH
ncbi:MAG: hypothetical protein M1839_002163 [Geoglossum umbratile]|nr:MAG: hypothetical protein M1839_002163 [Geoglossum umbratile]